MHLVRYALGTLLVAILVPRPVSTVDLDVGVPAGSALHWTRSFPAYSPPRGGLFPRTPERSTEPEKDRSSSKPRTPELNFRISDSVGFTRILTWDVGGHLSWTRSPVKTGPRTGEEALLPPPPARGSGLHWATVTPLLRLLLHPDIVPFESVIGHLIEIGEPTLATLEAASAEKDLRPAVAYLRRAITSNVDESPGHAKPIHSDSTRDNMLSRFCFEELIRHHAYDPEEPFAKRLLLFSDQTEAWVVRYAREGCVTLRRAAVAALGRYRTPGATDVLLERALFSDDAVETVRALAGLSNFHGPLDVTPLLDRLAKEDDPILKSALIAALGRPRAYAAVEPLMEIAREGIKRRKSGPAIEALAALIRILPRRTTAAPLEDFLERAASTLRQSAETFRSPAGRVSPDRPDGPRARSEILLQQTRILRLMLRPGDADLIRRLVELSDLAASGAGGGLEGPYFGRVHPPVRLQYLRALARAGADGQARLRRIATSESYSPSLRGHALSNLPYGERSELALSFLTRQNLDPVRLIGFETLLADLHPKLEAAARELLNECSGARSEPAPARDYLYLRAVRTLSERGRLAMVDLAPLIHTAESGEDAFGEELEEFREGAREVVDAWLRGLPRNRIRPMIRNLVKRVVQRGINPSLTELNREQVESYIEGHLTSLKGHKGDRPYRRLVIENIETALLGWTPAYANRARAQFTTPVGLGEEVLLALGRTRESSAADLLAEFLQNRRNANRYAAVLGLAMGGSKEHVQLLASFLLDGDPFVRFCAHEALRHLSDLDIDVDWMYGEPKERFDGAERYLEWALESDRER